MQTTIIRNMQHMIEEAIGQSRSNIATVTAVVPEFDVQEYIEYCKTRGHRIDAATLPQSKPASFIQTHAPVHTQTNTQTNIQTAAPVAISSRGGVVPVFDASDFDEIYTRRDTDVKTMVHTITQL